MRFVTSPVVLIGTAVSVGGVLLGLWLDQGADLTILLGLTLIVITLLVEVIHRLDDRRSLLGELLREGWLRPHVARVFEAAKEVERNQDLPGAHRARVRQELQRTLDRCARELQPIARGELTWDYTKPGYAPEVIHEAKQSIRAIMVPDVDGAWWEEDGGQHAYYRANLEAARDRRVEVQRVVVLTQEHRDELPTIERFLDEQTAAGVELWVVDLGKRPAPFEPIEATAIIDGRLVLDIVGGNGDPRCYRLTSAPGDVAERREQFEQLQNIGTRRRPR